VDRNEKGSSSPPADGSTITETFTLKGENARHAMEMMMLAAAYIAAERLQEFAEWTDKVLGSCQCGHPEKHAANNRRHLLDLAGAIGAMLGRQGGPAPGNGKE